MPFKSKAKYNLYHRKYRKSKKIKAYQRRYQRDYSKTLNGKQISKRAVEKKKTLLLSAKDKPCTDCHHKFPPCVMDFDHVRGKKKFGVGHLYSHSYKDIRKEIAKCDVVCANCHRIRTHITRK